MQPGSGGHEPLYLKHRPQSLAELVGQAAVARTLSNAINHERLVHAYLFTGPRGTGKTSTARILAKSLNCEKGPTTTPCGQCTQCLEIRDSKSPAVFEIDAASNNSVDDARVLIERAPLVAVGGRHKIYIIDECHMLTREAFNALLKTIEEPPPGVFFVLATTEEHKVPPTIVSRCQKLMFRLVNQNELSAYLRTVADANKIEIDDAALTLIARRSGGGLRDALGLLDQASLLCSPSATVGVKELLALLGAVNEDVLTEVSAEILARRGDRVLSVVNDLIIGGREPAVIAMELARHFLNLIKASYLAESGTVDADAASTLILGSPAYIEAIREQAPAFERAELAQIIEQLNRLEQSCRRSTQPAMQLEMGLLSVCHRHDITLVSDLKARIEALEASLSGGLPARARESRPLPATEAPRRQPPVPAMESLPPVASTIVEKLAETPVGQIARLTGEAWAAAADALAGHEKPVPAEVSSVSLIEAPAVLPPKGEAQAEADRDEEPPRKAGEPQSQPDDEDDLDTFWSDLLSDLHATSPSIHGVLSSFPFPVALTERELTIGVTNDMWKNNVEKRVEPIRAACQRVLGREVSVRVKVVSEAATRNQARARSDRAAGAPTDRQPRAQANPDDGDPEPALPETGGKGMQAHDPGSPDVEPKVVTGRAAQAKAAAAEPLAGSSTSVREAYKLFEGPGSRLIG